MASDRQLDLIARGMDGDLTGDEQQAFEALIEEDAEAGELHRRLGELDRALHEIDATEPPPEIREYVMARVRGRAYGRATAGDRMRSLIGGFLDVLRVRPAYGVALGLGLDVAPGAFFYLIPVTVLITTLPISLNSFGLREVSYVFAFAQVGVSAESAVAMSVFATLCMVGVSLVGGVLHLSGPTRMEADPGTSVPSARPADLTT